MVEKKGVSLFQLLFDGTRDYMINRVCKMYNIQYGLVLYNTLMFNPIETAISIIALKVGCNKVIISLIVLFII